MATVILTLGTFSVQEGSSSLHECTPDCVITAEDYMSQKSQDCHDAKTSNVTCLTDRNTAEVDRIMLHDEGKHMGAVITASLDQVN